MCRRMFCLVATLTMLTLLAAVLPAASAQEQAKIQGRYRIELMSGQYVEGDVTEQADGSYQVKTKYGAVVSVKKGDVRAVRPLDDAQTKQAGTPGAAAERGSSSAEREVTDEEIEIILAGIVATPDVNAVGAGKDELEAELAVEERSLEEMKKIAGRDAKVLLKPHFALVYTATDESTQKLAARVESVYRWKIQFMRMVNMPARRPAHKLEIFYFGTFAEFAAQGANENVGGFYSPDANRSYFFDGLSHPQIVELVKRSKDKNVPYEERQRLRVRINRFIDHQNLEVVQHETGHHIDFNIGLFPMNGLERASGCPRWLVEGTTMLFEVPPSTGGASLGVMNHSRLDELRTFMAKQHFSAAEWRTFLFDSPNFWSRKWPEGSSYPVGWSMVYYLWKEHRPELGKYYKTVLERDDNTIMSEADRLSEFENLFGRLDEKWVEDYNKFIDGLQLKKSLLPLGEAASERVTERKKSDQGRRDQGRGKRY